MGKLMYETPVMREEGFEANEYVAACWSIACEIGASGAEVKDTVNSRQWSTASKQYENVTHGAAQCGTAAHQQITGSGNSYTMTEIKVNGQPDLACTIMTDNWGQPTTLNHAPANNEMIYWTTSNYGVTWSHKGRAVANGNHS